MDVPADFDGGLELEEVGLAEEDVLGGGAEAADLRVGELGGAHRPPAARLQEPPDHVVERRRVHRPAPRWWVAEGRGRVNPGRAAAGSGGRAGRRRRRLAG